MLRRANRPLRVVLSLSQSHLSHFSCRACLHVFKLLSHFLVLSQDLNEYGMHVLIVNTRYPSTSMALAYLAVKKFL
jgi:hypothetical protein